MIGNLTAEFTEFFSLSQFLFQIDDEQFSKVMRYIKSGVNSGATLESGGDRIGDKGYYIQPTIFSNVKVKKTNYNL